MVTEVNDVLEVYLHTMYRALSPLNNGDRG